MVRTTRRLAPVLLVLAVYAATAACGGDPQPRATPTPTATAVPGLPAGYPADEVPVLYGVVTAQSGGTSAEGRQGWILEVSATGDKESCFADAAGALLEKGFVKKDEIVAGDTTQAQYTSAEYAVIISARSADNGICQVGYEVGELSK